VIKKQWDPKKSYSQNMKKLGLVAHPGAVVTTKDAEQNQQQSTVIELYDVPDSDTLEARKKKRPQSADDQKYIARLLAKYGDDYAAMFRDIKVNKMQYTETQLRKMASRFFLLDEEHRVVDVPERIKATSVSGN
jgi:nucleolar protein 16